jgi:hypothetical protein
MDREVVFPVDCGWQGRGLGRNAWSDERERCSIRKKEYEVGVVAVDQNGTVGRSSALKLVVVAVVVQGRHVDRLVTQNKLH